MKKFKLIVLFFAFCLFLISCKASKGCGCLDESNNSKTTETTYSKA